MPTAFLADITFYLAFDLVKFDPYLVLDLTKQGGIGS